MSELHVDIWNNFRDGDDNAFGELFEMFSDSLFRYGIKLVQDEELVKDCVQDLFIKIYKNRASLSTTTNPKFYLLHSLKNIIRDILVKKKRLVYYSPQEMHFFAEYEAPDSHDEPNENNEKFAQIIENLSPRQKESIYLRYQMDLSYEEIAQMLDINYQSTRNLIYRAITKIRSEMDFVIFLAVFLKIYN